MSKFTPRPILSALIACLALLGCFLPRAHAAAGNLDPLNASVVGSFVLASAVQPDGKIIIGGGFTSVLGQPRNNIARLNADGTLDAGFNPGANGTVTSVAVQADGRILLGGAFTNVGGTARNFIARVDAAGALDTGFNPNPNSSVQSVAVQADGRILLGGTFTTVGGTPRNRIARVDAAGALDASFNPNANAQVNSVAVQADGRILLGGNFTTLQPNGAGAATARQYIARVEADGTLDAGFNPNANNAVISVAVQANGRILLGGGFTTVSGTARGNIARVDAAGALDTGFNPNASGSVQSVAVQADGRILFAGEFTAVGGTVRNHIARVDAAGALDAGFNPNANNVVYSVAVQADGRILLGGAFSSVGGTARSAFARLLNDPATQTLSTPDTTQVTWTRGGSAPEVSQVTFENSTDSGATWTPLGSGLRIGSTSNWELTGLSLPVSGQLRARARTIGGHLSGSSSLIEQVAGYLVAAPTLTFVAPASGTTVGGTSVTLTGTGFGGATSVTFGGTAATTFSVTNTTTLTATIPAHAAGTVDVVVTTLAGTGTGTHLFTFVAPPTVTSIAPAIGSTFGGTSVTVTGTHLTGATAVTFGGTAATTFSVTNATTLTATAPAHAPGAVDVVVTTPGGAGTGPFTYVTPPPTVTLTTTGLRGTATTLTITGTNFSTTPGHNTVVFTPAGTGTVTASTATSLTVTGLSGQALGALNAVVTTNGLSSGAAVQVATVSLTLPGDLDPLDLQILGPHGSDSFINASAVQPDGKITIAGMCDVMSDDEGLTLYRKNIARINADGTPDKSFNELYMFYAVTGGSGLGLYVSGVAVQADGKILLGGDFTFVLGQPRNNIARLNANGTLDTGFDPNPNGVVDGVAVQADGKILFWGNFTLVLGQPRNGIARFNADGTLDAGFNPDVNGFVHSVAVQEDGRILLGGLFNTVGGTARSCIARVHATGALDTGFNPNANDSVSSMAVQADGKILLGGKFRTVGGASRNRIARLNANGTLDAGFNANVAGNGVHSIVVQTDGQILIAGDFDSIGGTQRNYIARLNADGTLDLGFNVTVNDRVLSVALQEDGRILLGGDFETVGGTMRNSFARLVNDPATQTLSVPDATQVTWTRGGSSPEVSHVTFERSADNGATWTPLGSGTRIGSTPNWQLTGLSLTGTGQLRARGRTAGGYNNGTSGLVGATEQYSFVAPTVTLSTAGLRMTERTLTITGTNFSLTPGNNSVAFTPAGTGTVTAATATSLTVGNLGGLTLGALNAVVTTYGRSSGAAVQVATVVVPGPGDVDPLSASISPVGGSHVLASAVQTDGKTILVGNFNSVLGQPRNHIARLNADGTLDAGFNPGANGQVNAVSVQADGRILLGGAFTSVGGTARNHIARVDAAGALDTGFNPNANNIVTSVAVQADGRILLGGEFTTLQPNGAALATTRNRIARVDAVGALDTGFNPDANGPVSSVAVQADGRILLGGSFTALQPNGAAVATTRNRIARVDAAGALDVGFNPDANGSVFSVAEQADGRILLGGGFTAAGKDARSRIARVYATGVLDMGFNPSANNIVLSVVEQADGRILLGGFFTSLGGTARNRIARLDASGAPDAGFNPNADNIVYSVAVQANGRILLGGAFTSMGGNSRTGFARLVNDPATQTLSVPDATQVTWTRGGSSPQVSQVTFERSTDSGATWTPLGSGTRIGGTPDWQLTGLSLTGTGQLRARGRTSGGYHNGSSDVLEQVIAFTLYTPLQQWKLTRLGGTEAPNDGDTDFDGLRTLLEYATGGDPLVPGALPAASTDAGKLTLTFPRNTAATDVTLTVQGSDDLSTWTNLARSTAGGPMVPLIVGVDVAETGAGALRTVEVRDLFLITDPAHPRRFLRLHGAP